MCLLACSLRTPTASVSFERRQVLVTHTLPLTVTNVCPIQADFKLFIESSESAFSVEPRSGSLAPGESLTATVSVLMDEVLNFVDTLHVLVQEGPDICVPLTASGAGSTLVCDALPPTPLPVMPMTAKLKPEMTEPPLNVLDFGDQFVARPFGRELVVANMGRKPVSACMHACHVAMHACQPGQVHVHVHAEVLHCREVGTLGTQSPTRKLCALQISACPFVARSRLPHHQYNAYQQCNSMQCNACVACA